MRDFIQAFKLSAPAHKAMTWLQQTLATINGMPSVSLQGISEAADKLQANATMVVSVARNTTYTPQVGSPALLPKVVRRCC